MAELNSERQSAVRGAWANEKIYVRHGFGSRNWTEAEQREILTKGRVKGYEGQHMKSVKDYPQLAGDRRNIQFLNRAEHIQGAHKGNTQNATNGYYDPATGTMHSWGNKNPIEPQRQALRSPLTNKQQNLAIKREQTKKQLARQAKAENKRPVTKSVQGNVRGSQNKGIEAARLRAAQRRSSSGTTKSQTPSRNKAIETFRQTRSSANTTGKSASRQAGGSSRGGQSRGSSKGR